jgi:hypothetical protein
VIYGAWKRGCIFDAWSEHFRYDLWLEAFAEAGLTPEFYANRPRPYDEVFPWDHLDYYVDKAFLIRENEKGRKEIHTLNLNDANLINSPYYYLQQNDVIYVTPNKVKAQNSSVGSMTSLWFSATSILISLTSLLYNILSR